MAQIPLFNLFFLGLGLALGWGVRRFHSNIVMFSNPTVFGILQSIANTLISILVTSLIGNVVPIWTPIMNIKPWVILSAGLIYTTLSLNIRIYFVYYLIQMILIFLD